MSHSGIAFVLEAPSNDLSGAAGVKFESLLASVGLTRGQVDVLYLFKEIPQGNPLPQGLLGPEPTQEFIGANGVLHLEIARSTARVFIPMGNMSLYALTGQYGITERRGSLWPCTLMQCEGKTVIPTFHPGSATRDRNPINHFIIQMDLMKAVAFTKGELVIPPDPMLLLDPGFEELMAFLARCNAALQVGIDIETSTARVRSDRYTREMTTFSIALPGESMAVPLTLPQTNESRWLPEEEDAILCALFEVLENENVLKVGQNLSYDASFFYHRYGTVLWPFEDTMMGARITCPDLPANLGFLCSIHTMQPYYKDLAGRGNWQDFLRYSALDSDVVLKIWPRVERDLRNQGNWDTYCRARNAFLPALFVQEHGLLLDKVEQKKKAKQVREEMDLLQKLIDIDFLAVKEKDPVWLATKAMMEAELEVAKTKKRGTKGREEALAKMTTLNVKSPDQLTSFLYGKKPSGLGLPALVRDGKTSTDDKARKRLIGKGVTIVKTLDTLIRLANDYSKYWDVPTDPDDRIRCMMATTGTDTGRWSSQISMFSTGCQFQNMPKRFKPLLIAEDGRPFIQMDLAQAENREVAIFANDHRMMEAFALGLDVHRLTAGLMLGKDPSTISDEPGSSPLGDGKHSERDWGKRCNHAFNYGMGPGHAAEELEISARDAKFLYDAYHRAYPNVRNVFWANVEETIRKTHYLVNLFGRKRLYLLPLDGQSKKEAYAFLPQSSIPDLLVDRVMLPIYRANEPEVSLVNHVHDSLEYTFDLRMHASRAEGLLAMARFILRLKGMAEQPLTYKTTTFTIPADFKVGWSFGSLKDVKGNTEDELAASLDAIL